MLDFQKLEAGITVNISDNDINEAVREVYELMVLSSEQKGIKLNVNLENQLPNVEFNKDKIIQVLTNLVDNAIKFTEKGEIIINTSAKGNALYVSVQDSGPGITEQDLPRLFNKFEQVSNIKHKKVGGTGLGLAISKEIIMQHKGKIWAESELGKGTTIWFLLPIV